MAVKAPKKPQPQKEAAPEVVPEAAQEAPEAPAEQEAAHEVDKAADPDAPIYVRATRVGYYDHSRRYPAGSEHPTAGQVFVLRSRDGIRKAGGRNQKIHITAAQQFSSSWMEVVDQNEGAVAVVKQSRRPLVPAVIRKTAAARNVI